VELALVKFEHARARISCGEKFYTLEV